MTDELDRRDSNRAGRPTQRTNDDRGGAATAKRQFVMRTKAMLESDAWRSLDRQDRLMLDAIELAYMNGGWKRAGWRIVTVDEFVAFGMRRNDVGSSRRKLVDRKLIEFRPGGFNKTTHRQMPNEYRPTYVHHGKTEPPDSWRDYKAEKPGRENARVWVQKPSRVANPVPWPSRESATMRSKS
jgi:hypothetical protein